MRMLHKGAISLVVYLYLFTFVETLGNISDADPFLLTSHSDDVYVVTLASPLTGLWYRLEIMATDSGSLSTSSFLDIFVDDDHPDALSFTQTIYGATLYTDTLPGTDVLNLSKFFY